MAFGPQPVFTGEGGETTDPSVTTYADIAEAKSASGSDQDLCYIVDVKSFYEYVASGSAYTANDTTVLTTGDAGNTRWVGVAGQYNYNEVPSSETVYDAVSEAKAASGDDNDFCWVVATETWYRYEESGSAYTANDTTVLTTGDAGNTRWVGVAGQYVAGGLTVDGSATVDTLAVDSSTVFGGGVARPLATKAANYELTESDHTIAVDTTLGDVTITVPTAVGISADFSWRIFKMSPDTNKVTVSLAVPAQGNGIRSSYTLVELSDSVVVTCLAATDYYWFDTELLRTFVDVATAEATTGTDNDLCYVIATETLYRYEASGSAYTDDNTFVLSTGDGGNTRWLGVAGRYILGSASFNSELLLSATTGSTPSSGIVSLRAEASGVSPNRTESLIAEFSDGTQFTLASVVV